MAAVVMSDTLAPQPGDVVRLDGEYDVLVKPGSTGVVDGAFFGTDFGDGRGPCVLVVFNLYRGAAFRGPLGGRSAGPTHISASGGPAPMVALAALELAGTIEQTFWRWKDCPRADGGERFTKTVNLWSWTPNTKDNA